MAGAVSWAQQAPDSDQLKNLMVVGLPRGLAVALLALPLLWMSAELDVLFIGAMLSLVIFAIAFWVGARATTAANAAAAETLPRIRLTPEGFSLHTDAGPRFLALDGLTMRAGWYNRRPASASAGAWIHLDDGNQTVTILGHEDHLPGKEAGMPAVEGGAPPAGGVVYVSPVDVADIWQELKRRGVG